MGALERFDERLYRAERALVAAMLAIMGVVVFLDVMLRVTTREGSPLANPLVQGVAFGVLTALGLRYRGVARAPLLGVGGGVAAVLFIQLMLLLFPNGLIWSQTLALAFTLWLGMVGATLAAHDRRHLALDIGSKLWPPALAPKVAAVGHGVTALFCLSLVFLGYRSVSAHYATWADSEGSAGIFPVQMELLGFELPIIKWVVFTAIPYGGASLFFRFTLDAARAWTGRLPVGEDDTLQQLGIQPSSALGTVEPSGVPIGPEESP
jgi:TRAP-type C4-dicarboxylate transport system permease small subunit